MIHRLCLTIALLLVPAVAVTQTPQTMSYQGVLTDGAGIQVPDGPYNLTFRIYDMAAGGAALWTEAHVGVDVVRGRFSLILGSAVPVDLPFDRQYWLGISVGGDPELASRVQLTASPYVLGLRAPVTTVLTYNGYNIAPPGGANYSFFRNLASFTKLYSSTNIELTWMGHMETQGGSFCDFQIRVDGLANSSQTGRAVLYTPGTGAAVQNAAPFSVSAQFTGLSAGSHTLSVWLRGFATNCLLNYGNFPYNVVVREMQPTTGVASEAIAITQDADIVNGVQAPGVKR